MHKQLFVFLCIAVLAACQQGGTSSDGVQKKSLISGYDYEHHVQTTNKKPQVSDFVYFDMDLYDPSDSLLQTFRSQDPLPSVQILEPTDENRKRNPLVDIISLLAIGDSVAIIVPKDSIGGMPPGMEDVPHIEYHIVPREILTEAEQKERIAKLQAESMAAMEEMRKEIPRIEALTESTLADYKSGKLKTEETSNGVKYFIHEKGDGELPLAQRMVTMNYYGRTVSDGQRFDDSFSRGRGYSFRVANDAVIQGWHEIAPYLPLGTKASVFIPSQLGYMERGSPPNIGPNAELYFYMEVADLRY